MCARLLFTGVCVVWLIGPSAGDCVLPPHPAHGYHQPKGGSCGRADQPLACDGTPGTLAPKYWQLTVHCDPGYQHSNPSATNASSICLHGKWSIPQLPPCVIPGPSAGDCVLPPHPAYGHHQPKGPTSCGRTDQPLACDGTPGTLAPKYWQLTVHCDPGYQHSNPSATNASSICLHGKWSIPQLPPCVIPEPSAGDCVLPPHPAHGSHQPKGGSCGRADQPLACDGTPGTLAPKYWQLTVHCDPGYQHSNPSAANASSICLHGKWSIPQLPPCVISGDGGLLRPTGTTPTVPPTLYAVSPSVFESIDCALPTASSTRRFCSLDAGCEDCDFYHRRCHISSGTRVKVLKVVCAPGYTIQQTNDVAVCQTAGWYPSLSECIKLCPPLVSEALLLKCRHGTDLVTCDKPSQPGTSVSFQCLPSFNEYPDLTRTGVYRRTITCLQSGKWSTDLPPCKAACGVSKEVTTISSAIVDGKDAHIGFFPWHAGLYYRTEEDGKTTWDQKCGGSLISNRVVLTAAHCLYGVIEYDLRVALGKYYRSWDTEEPTAVKRNVSEISLPPEYNNKIYSYDVALVLLSEKIKFGEYIMPVCRDYNERTDLLQNFKLYVAGWGKTSSADGPPSENLVYNTVDKITQNECKLALPVYFSAFEKICAVKNNSESVIQKGDSGGGLTAVYEDGLHYVVGVVSTKTQQFTSVGSQEVSMFTNIKCKIHTEWIESKKTQFTNKYGS